MVIWPMWSCSKKQNGSSFKGIARVKLTLNDLYHIIPHELCRCQVKDVHALQSFVLIQCEEK